MENILCNLCGSNDYKIYLQLPDWQLDDGVIRSTLVQCNTCSLIFQNPQPSLSELAASYPPEYGVFTTQESLKKKNWLMQKVERFGIKKRVRTVVRRKKTGRILDVGCATGRFLKEMERIGGWELFGVEVNEYAANYAQQYTNAQITIGTLDELQFSENYFDVITMWDVLEHVANPAASLRRIVGLLKPGGYFIARVPNHDSWDARLFRQYWAGYEPPRHLYVFGKKHILDLVRKSGLQVIQTSSEFGSYMVIVLSIKFLLKGKRIPENIRKFLLKFLYHPVTRILVSPFFYLVSIFFQGPLLTVVAKKTMET